MAIKVSGTKSFEQRIQKLKNKTRKTVNSRVTVGFAAPYAIDVHEDLETPHAIGNAKFLENPARELAPILRGIIRAAAREGDLLLGQLSAGRTLLEAATEQAPMDTGALRLSGFVAERSEEQQVAQRKAQEAIQFRQAILASRKSTRGAPILR